MASYVINIDKIGKQLLDLKSKLEKKKSLRSEIQGELNSVKKQMKESFSTDDLNEIKAQLEENEIRLEKMEIALKSQVDVLQRSLENMEAIEDDEQEEE